MDAKWQSEEGQNEEEHTASWSEITEVQVDTGQATEEHTWETEDLCLLYAFLCNN